MIAKKMLGLALAGAVLSSCTVVRQGDVGVKRTLGKISKRELQPGPRLYNPFLTTIIQVPTRTTNLEVKLSPTVCLSTQQAEYYALSEGTKEALNLRFLLQHYIGLH